MYNSQEIANRIKKLAKEQGKSLGELLSSCELGINTVSKMSKGTDILTLNFAKIADQLNCSVDYLLGRSLSPKINAAPILEEEEKDIIKIPLSYLKVSAGTGYYISDDYDDVEPELIDVNADKYPLARKADFAIQVKGDSMEPNYHDGDTLLIRSQPALDNGDIGIFNLNGEGYVKKYYEDQYGTRTLVSINEDYPPIILKPYDKIKVYGRVLCAL